MSYGVDLAEAYTRAATLVDRILQGAKPADLPFEEPTRYPFLINLRTAKALGLDIPPQLLARADEVIEEPDLMSETGTQRTWRRCSVRCASAVKRTSGSAAAMSA